MDCCQCQGIEDLFSEQFVSYELKQYHKKGPEKTTRLMIDALKSEGVQGLTLLDIGGGVGAIQHQLIEAGVEQATDIDASNSYLHAAMREAEQRDIVEHITFQHGNFVALAPSVPPADIVTLDRVICCYPDMPTLVSLSVERARKYYGVVFPRDIWWTRIGLKLLNFTFWVRRENFRTFVHPTQAVEAIINRSGFKRRFYHHTMVWQVIVYSR